MENQTTNTQSQEEKVKDFGHDVLLPVLYFVFDAFENAGMRFFLVKQTAQDAIAKMQLSGDCVTIGVRRHIWDSGDDFLLRSYLDNWHIPILYDKHDRFSFMYQNVPVHVYFYDDSPQTVSLVPVMYEHESFWLPNTFATFVKEDDHD